MSALGQIAAASAGRLLVMAFAATLALLGLAAEAPALVAVGSLTVGWLARELWA